MKKDELLGLLDKLDELSGLIATTHPHLSSKWGDKDHEAYAEIKQILNLHFSISEEERKEAIDALNKQKSGVKSGYFAHSFIVFKPDDKTIKTILKALGEKVR